MHPLGFSTSFSLEEVQAPWEQGWYFGGCSTPGTSPLQRGPCGVSRSHAHPRALRCDPVGMRTRGWGEATPTPAALRHVPCRRWARGGGGGCGLVAALSPGSDLLSKTAAGALSTCPAPVPAAGGDLRQQNVSTLHSLVKHPPKKTCLDRSRRAVAGCSAPAEFFACAGEEHPWGWAEAMRGALSMRRGEHALHRARNVPSRQTGRACHVVNMQRDECAQNTSTKNMTSCAKSMQSDEHAK